MKHVKKAAAAPVLDAWKASANLEWQPTYSDLQNPEKHDLHTALLAEQGWVCCYCGRSVAQQDSHIEHFRPQSQRPDLALSYENLHASCIRETDPGTPLHCGHAKGSEFNETRHISPLDPACEARFIYSFDGQIIATGVADTEATYMVHLLKLDIAFLRDRRQQAIRLVFDPIFLATVTDDELRVLRDSFRRYDENGRASSFGHVLSRVAEQRLLDSAS